MIQVDNMLNPSIGNSMRTLVYLIPCYVLPLYSMLSPFQC